MARIAPILRTTSLAVAFFATATAAAQEPAPAAPGVYSPTQQAPPYPYPQPSPYPANPYPPSPYPANPYPPNPYPPNPQYTPTPYPPYPQYPPGPPAPAERAAPAAPRPAEWRPSQTGVVIAVDRVFGLFLATGTRSATQGSAEEDVSETTVNVLGGSPSSSYNPFAVPLLSVSGIVGSGITVGGGIGYASDSRKQGATIPVNVDMSTFAAAPRVGFVVDLGRVASLWLRGGLTYSAQKYVTSFGCGSPPTYADVTCTSTQTIKALDLSFDPVFVLSPVAHLGFLIGPTADVALSGSDEDEQRPSVTFTDPNSPVRGADVRDLHLSSFGVAAGVALFL